MIPLLARLLGAAVAGALLAASFPPVGLWWTALAAFALLVVVLAPVGRHPAPRARTGALHGFAAGAVFFLLLVPWVGLYVGAYAAWALAAVEALYLAGFGAGAVLILGAGLREGRRAGWRAVGAVLGVAGWWSLWEWLRSTWPWGGFPWGRLAFGQADGPLLGLVGVGGVPLLGFVVVSIGAALGMAVLLLSRRGARAGWRPLAGLAAVLVVSAGGALASSLVALMRESDTNTPGEYARIVAIQGNVPRLGLDFNAQRRAVLENHLRVTREFADRVDSGAEEPPDIVLWPENGSDISPLRDRRAAADLTELSLRLDAPILVGTVLPVGDGPEATNTVLVWDGGAGGPTDRHDKRYIQPFGEWLPLREPLEKLFPVARTAGHFVPGDGDGMVHADGVALGVATCFEVAFDAAAREPVSRGAGVLTVPTNNATFGRSPMTYQQLAMSRVRAVEHHVPVIIAATSGVSAVIRPDGSVAQQSGIFETAVLSSEVRVDGTGTVATRLGGVPQAISCLAGLVALAWGLTRRPRPVTDPRRRT